MRTTGPLSHNPPRPSKYNVPPTYDLGVLLVGQNVFGPSRGRYLWGRCIGGGIFQWAVVDMQREGDWGLCLFPVPPIALRDLG